MTKRGEEREYKFLVDEKAFMEANRIIEGKYPLSKRKETLQVNYYYDNEKLDLRKEGVTLRVRTSDGRLYLQKKEHIKTPDQYSLALEEEKKIDKLPATLIYRDESYSMQGSLVTNRKVYFIDENIEIAFDISFYFGIMDYEIEIEFKEDGLDLVICLIKEMGLEGIEGRKGKASRFFKARIKSMGETYIL